MPYTNKTREKFIKVFAAAASDVFDDFDKNC